jgi:hypothetical protein
LDLWSEIWGSLYTLWWESWYVVSFYSFEFLLQQVSMVAMVVRRKEKSKEDRREREREEDGDMTERRKEFQERKKKKSKVKNIILMI